MVRQSGVRAGVRTSEKRGRPPKSDGRGPTLSVVLAPIIKAGADGNSYWAAKTLIGLCGSLTPKQLTPSHIDHLNTAILASGSQHTRCNRSASLRRILRSLWEDHGASRLDGRVVKARKGRPRAVTATSAERASIISSASPYLKLWLLFCSDLAIRAGTAAQLGPSNYDAETRKLTYTTKYDARQIMTVTAEIAAILSSFTFTTDAPFVAQIAAATPRGRWGQKGHRGVMGYYCLTVEFVALRRKLGITRKLTAHDLRRTTAVRLYEESRDLRKVQALLGHSDLPSTLWYLDHHLTPVNVEALELAKLNPTKETIQ